MPWLLIPFWLPDIVVNSLFLGIHLLSCKQSLFPSVDGRMLPLCRRGGGRMTTTNCEKLQRVYLGIIASCCCRRRQGFLLLIDRRWRAGRLRPPGMQSWLPPPSQASVASAARPSRACRPKQPDVCSAELLLSCPRGPCFWRLLLPEMPLEI